MTTRPCLLISPRGLAIIDAPDALNQLRIPVFDETRTARFQSHYFPTTLLYTRVDAHTFVEAPSSSPFPNRP